MKWAGVLFVVVSAGSMGFQIAASLNHRCRIRRELISVLQILRNEIEVRGTPLPQCFALMSASGKTVRSTLFGTGARDMDANRWVTPSDAMDRALTDLEEPALRQILMPLASQLGKYDLEAQLQGIVRAKQETDTLLCALEHERRIKSKTYRTLGICMGLAVAILLV